MLLIVHVWFALTTRFQPVGAVEAQGRFWGLVVPVVRVRAGTPVMEVVVGIAAITTTALPAAQTNMGLLLPRGWVLAFEC